MKLIFICFFAFIFTFGAAGQQTDKLFGAHSNGTSRIFSSTNVSTNSYTQISVLNSSSNSTLGETTFDDIHYRYFVKIASTIFVIDALSGIIVDSLMNVGSFYNMEYDKVSNNLLGMSTTGTLVVSKTYNLSTKTGTIKNTLISVDSIVVGESTFDPLTRRYFSMTNLGVIVIDSNGVLTDVLCSSPNLYGMEYNPLTNRINYLEWNGINFDFISVEANTCNISVLGSLTGLTSAVRGESTFDKALGHYYNKTNLGIVQLNTQTGLLTQTLSAINNFGGLEFKSIPANTAIQIQNFEKEISVFPNPSESTFNFNHLKSGTLLNIYDLNGKSIFQTVSKESFFVLNLEGEVKGIYFYTLHSSDGDIQRGKLVLK